MKILLAAAALVLLAACGNPQPVDPGVQACQAIRAQDHDFSNDQLLVWRDQFVHSTHPALADAGLTWTSKRITFGPGDVVDMEAIDLVGACANVGVTFS